MYFMLRRRMSDVARKTAEIEKAKAEEAKYHRSFSHGPSFEEKTSEPEDDSESACTLSRTGTIPLSRATMHNTREVPCALFTQINAKTKFDTKECKISAVSFSRGGDLLVSDANNNKVKMFDLKGSLRVELTILPEYGKLKYPVGVCGFNTGEVFVADRDAGNVKVFTSEGCIMTSFAQGLQKPTIMTSTTSKQVILLEDSTKKVYMYNAMTEDHICLHDTNKKHMTFKSPSGIAVVNDNIVISDCGQNQLMMFDDHGQFLSTFGGSKTKDSNVIASNNDIAMERPISIATDRGSNILILDKTRLLSFDPKSSSFKLIMNLDGTPVRNAAGVATSHNGFTAIYTADGSTVYIFKYFERL